MAIELTDDGTMDTVVTFQNVAISIKAANPKAAYVELCRLLAAAEGFETDTYTVGDEVWADGQSTEVLS